MFIGGYLVLSFSVRRVQSYNIYCKFVTKKKDFFGFSHDFSEK
jgi:hypothetical protein